MSKLDHNESLKSRSGVLTMMDQADDFQAIMDRYIDGPARLEEVLAGLADSLLDLALTSDTWTIRQIVHHIVDGDDLWKMCIKAALGSHVGPISLQWYWDKPQTEWAEYWDYATRNIQPSLVLFRANRQYIGELLRTIPDAWEKAILLTWPGKQDGQITIRDVLQMQARHVFEHVEEIQMILKAHWF